VKSVTRVLRLGCESGVGLMLQRGDAGVGCSMVRFHMFHISTPGLQCRY
jgi:hypothetical protein